MKHLAASIAMTGALLCSGAAYAQCGDITIAGFSWQSAETLAYVDQFILKNGYDCNATVITGDTVPSITSMAEKGQPDIVPEATPSLLPALVAKALEDGRIKELGPAVIEGATSGWYIPKYVADAHPDIKTVPDALKHPDLFPAPEKPGKGGILMGPQGWGDTVVTAQIFKAFGAEDKGFVIVPTGSAAGLDGAITKAYERKEGFIAAYWSPTSLLQKYPMVRLDAGVDRDEAEWKRCTTVADCPDPKPNYWVPVPMVTLVSDKFATRSDVGPALDYLKKRNWSAGTVGGVMAWMTDNQASGADGARHFLKENQDLWTKWVPADVAEKVKSAL
ncbi:glycine betaine ABC transporter substrate-binding protein [Mesorhizobium sp.]|uniref:glycine betaine ABC transporter substrate-binding protein n=1 Tax=Mesorhizobium sp. TaxID=1871066 RepID=UPI000FE7CF3E|nr:glycine betaine ABC transporter substrate-binding protein [Mesorhizobium sp.]RWB69926.1 MAG: ABC transporter substrate-binding protein [Mesorhizobium sp.]